MSSNYPPSLQHRQRFFKRDSGPRSLNAGDAVVIIDDEDVESSDSEEFRRTVPRTIVLPYRPAAPHDVPPPVREHNQRLSAMLDDTIHHVASINSRAGPHRPSQSIGSGNSQLESESRIASRGHFIPRVPHRISSREAPGMSPLRTMTSASRSFENASAALGASTPVGSRSTTQARPRSSSGPRSPINHDENVTIFTESALLEYMIGHPSPPNMQFGRMEPPFSAASGSRTGFVVPDSRDAAVKDIRAWGRIPGNTLQAASAIIDGTLLFPPRAAFTGRRYSSSQLALLQEASEAAGRVHISSTLLNFLREDEGSTKNQSRSPASVDVNVTPLPEPPSGPSSSTQEKQDDKGWRDWKCWKGCKSCKGKIVKAVKNLWSKFRLFILWNAFLMHLDKKRRWKLLWKKIWAPMDKALKPMAPPCAWLWKKVNTPLHMVFTVLACPFLCMYALVHCCAGWCNCYHSRQRSRTWLHRDMAG